MKKSILLLTNTEDDPHVNFVTSKLKEMGERFFRFNSDNLSKEKSSFNLISNKSGFDLLLVEDGEEIKSNQIKSVWFRRPNFFDLEIKDPFQKNQAENELLSCLNNAWSILDDCFWISDPFSIQKANNKIYQLKVARNIGFNVPHTIVTNSPDRFMSFYKKHNREIIYKTFKQPYFDYEDDEFIIPTTKITEDHISNLEIIRSTPVLLQELISKKYEIRITMVGESIFPIKINSQDYKETSLDWRVPEYISKFNYELIELPADIIIMCKKLLKTLDLYFGAIDLIVDKDNNFVFLEINPNGQWQWLEYFTGINISGEIANSLAYN